MHPLFESPRRLLLYLAAWLPIAALLAYVLAAGGDVPFGEASLESVPLCLFYAFLCVPAWYTCRALPLSPMGTPRAVGTHLGAAIVAGGVWALCARALGMALAQSTAFRRLGPLPDSMLRLVFGMGVLLYLMTVAAFYVGLSVGASRAAEARLLQTAVLAREAELRALKAQVNPHFLFNSLNSIGALTAADPARAREMCILLGDFLRRTLGIGEQPAIPLAEELSLVHAFLAIEKIRYGDRLRIEEQIAPGAAGAMVPPLLLQPLVENAVVHGIASLVAGGCIRMSIVCHDSRLGLSIENDFDPEAPPRRGGGGVGLANVRGRLAGRFGAAAQMDVNAAAGSFHVRISLPLETRA